MFFALGIVFTGWSVLSDISDAAGGALLLIASKRMLLAFFILCYLTQVWRENILPRHLLFRLALASVATGVTAATLYGIVQGAMKHDRILLGINRAKLTAYAYSVTTLVLMATLLQLKERKAAQRSVRGPCSVVAVHGGADRNARRHNAVVYDLLVRNDGDVDQRERPAVEAAGQRRIVKFLQPVGGVWIRTAPPCVKQHRDDQRQFFMAGVNMALHRGHGIAHQPEGHVPIGH